MKKYILFTILLIINNSIAQNIKKIYGHEITSDNFNKRIVYLMKTVNISGVVVSVHNNNKHIFNKSYGLANVRQKVPLKNHL